MELEFFSLQNRSEDWWCMIESRRKSIGDISLDEFKKTFFDKFYPRSFRDEKQSEFLKLNDCC